MTRVRARVGCGLTTFAISVYVFIALIHTHSPATLPLAFLAASYVKSSAAR